MADLGPVPLLLSNAQHKWENALLSLSHIHL